MSKCLYCYQETGAEQQDFHPACSKRLFGTAQPPLLPYNREHISELAEQIIRSQATLTGVQPKLSLDIHSEKGSPKRFTIVGLWGRYILKPQTDQYPHLPELEDATMHLAEIARMATVPHALIRFSDGELCYITRRIDRGNNGKKFLMEDMCQLSERLTEYKYKGSYEQIARLILKHSSTPKLDLVNFWEQVLFSWLTGNADMHLKNFSLYSLRPDAHMLTPAYDMLSTALVMPEDTEELALTLNGKKRKLKRSDFETAFLQSGLNQKVIENIFTKFEKSYPLWLDFLDQSFLPETIKAAYKELIKKRHTRLNLHDLLAPSSDTISTE
jgi:serine/threonine-protein kinase HipA